MKEKLSLSDHPLLSQQCFLGRALRKPPLHERYDFQAFGRYQQQMISGELALRNFAARHPLAGYNIIAGLAVAGLLTAAALVQPRRNQQGNTDELLAFAQRHEPIARFADERAAAVERGEALKAMLEDVKTKSRRQKLEDAGNAMSQFVKG